MQLEPNFWQTKSLLEMTQSEWEALCDGCGKCCYRKYIQGRGKRQKLYYTRIACNLLDLETGKCGNYSERFNIETDCTKLTKKNADILIKNGIHEHDVIDWFEFIIDEDHTFK